MRLINEESLAFDDLSIVPQHSEIYSRSECNTEVTIGGDTHQPLFLAGMFALDNKELGKQLTELGGRVFLPRGIKKVTWGIPSFGMDVDVGYSSGTIVTIDTAFGDSNFAYEAIAYAKSYGYYVIAGTVDTYMGAYRLKEAGADAIRVGIGPGRACSTRMVAGVGRGLATAIMEAKDAVGNSVPVICDGGIRKPGDFAKAIALGADAVIVGYLFAQTKEAEVTDYYGMASEKAMQQIGREGTPEGISVSVSGKSSIQEVVGDLLGGLRSAMSYTGARSVREFQQKVILQRLSPAAQRESKFF